MGGLPESWHSQYRAVLRSKRARACYVAFFYFLLFMLWNLFTGEKGQVGHFELSVDFKVRSFLGLDPEVAPRLKILAFDDPTVFELGTVDVDLDTWAALFQTLARQGVDAVLVDKLFDLRQDLDQAARFRETLRSLSMQIAIGSFVTETKIKGRPEVQLREARHSVRELVKGNSELEDLLGALDLRQKHVYGPHRELADAFPRLGHIRYPGLGRTIAMERLSSDQVLPHLALWAADELQIVDGVLLANKRPIPLQHGLIQINIVDPGKAKWPLYSMRDVLRRIRAGQELPIIKPHDIVLILPALYTGNGDWTMTPVGQIPGGYLVASVVSSVLTGNWLKVLGYQELLLALAVALGGYVGTVLYGRVLWFTVFFFALGITVVGLLLFATFGIVVAWLSPQAAFILTAMSLFVENSRTERWQKLRLETELETAGLVQRAFLPRANTQPSPLKVLGYYRPATQCGGDWWWHDRLSPSYELVIIGDVTGHGTPAALVAAAIYAAVQSLVYEHQSAAEPLRPARVLHVLNKVISSSLRGELLMTMFVACIDTDARRMYFSNAGHITPLMYRDGQRYSLGQYRPGGLLGFEDAKVFPEHQLDLQGGDRIVMFTDGLVENKAGGGLPLSYASFATLVGDMARESAESLGKELFSHMASTPNNDDTRDDCTLVIVEMPKAWLTDKKLAG